jgi:hypothetical protein
MLRIFGSRRVTHVCILMRASLYHACEYVNVIAYLERMKKCL